MPIRNGVKDGDGPGGGGPGGGTVGGGLFRADDALVEIYVDANNGNDVNNGLTPGTALATIQGIREKFPWELRAKSRRIIHLMNGTAAPVTYYDDCIDLGGGSENAIANDVWRGPDMIQITPATGPATAALDVTPAVRVDQSNAPSGTGNRTRFDFTAAAPGWTVGDLAGRCFVRVTRGSVKVFHELPIVENGADWFIVDDYQIIGTLLATDIAELVEPAVRIEAAWGASFGVLTVQGQSGIVANILTNDDQGACFERIGFGHIYASNVIGLQFDRCHFYGPYESLATGGSIAFTSTLSQAGWICEGRSMQNFDCREDDVGVDPIDPAPQTGLQVVIDDAWSGGLRVGGHWGDSPRGHGSFTNANGLGSAKRGLSIYGSNEDGIRVDGPGSEFICAKDGAHLNGSGNAGVGVRTRHGAVARIPKSPRSGITGVGGDLMVEQGVAVSYGSGVGEFNEVAGWDGNLTRVLEGSATHPTGDCSRITDWDYRVGNK